MGGPNTRIGVSAAEKCSRMRDVVQWCCVGPQMVTAALNSTIDGDGCTENVCAYPMTAGHTCICCVFFIHGMSGQDSVGYMVTVQDAMRNEVGTFHEGERRIGKGKKETGQQLFTQTMAAGDWNCNMAMITGISYASISTKLATVYNKYKNPFTSACICTPSLP